jgi:hypothetical protein
MRRIAKWRPGIENPGGGKIEAKALADAGDQQAGTTYTAGSPPLIDAVTRTPPG